MGTLTRYQNPPLIQAIEEDPYGFELHQIISLITQIYDQKEEFGTNLDPAYDKIQIKSHISFATPSSPIHRIQTQKDGRKVIWLNTLLLAGIYGPLPTPYVEMLFERNRQKDLGFQDFLDIFQHRIIALWYFVQKKFLPTLGVYQPMKNTLIGRTISNLIGVSSFELPTSLPYEFMFTYHCFFWCRTRSLEGLQRILGTFLSLPIHISGYRGVWCYAPSEDWSRIGLGKGRFNVLSKTMILGKKIWDQTACVDITMLCKNFTEYKKLLPEKGVETDLTFVYKVCITYLDPSIQTRLFLVLKGESIPKMFLNQTSRLGYSTWLRSTSQAPKDAHVRIVL